jgi:DNA polymerase I-like protein with 3'-5' exonuclease and polymerase domains
VGFEYKDMDNYLAGFVSSKDRLRIFKLGFDCDALDSMGRTIVTTEMRFGIDNIMGGNADLSQAEARIVAALAGETGLLDIFNSGGCIHRKNAANIFKKKEEDVTEKERELAKRITHASNYGMGPITFARTAGISTHEAKTLLNTYFARYPKIKLWHMKIASDLKRSRVLVTPFGRKRTFFNRYDESLLKEAYAYIPQSTVADLLNMGLRRLYAKTKGTEVEILLQIHDAVLVQCPTNQVTQTATLLRDTLTIPITVDHLPITIPVDISVGENWGELKKLSLP